MMLELGSSSVEFIRVGSEFSNAVLVAVLPYITDVAKKLELPLTQPLIEHVTECSIKPTRNWGAEVGFDCGWVFAFSQGYVQTIQSDHSFTMLQEPEQIARYFGELRMSRDEAIELARDSLKKLDIDLESVFAEQEPSVGGPRRIGANTVPHYQVTWPNPEGGSSVEIEINGNLKRVERIQLRNKILECALPKLSVIPLRDPSYPVWPRVNPQYARKLVPIVLRAVEDYAEHLRLPVSRPLTTNQVARFKLEEDRNSPHVEVRLTNGWRFDFNHTRVNGFYAPDNLFSSHSEQHAIRIRDLTGKWNMTEGQAKELVRKAVARLGYPTNVIHFEVEPQMHKPGVPGIPRYMFYWNYVVGPNDFLQSSISAEVDAEKGELKSLYVYDQSFYNEGPKIDVPISLSAGVSGPTAPLALPSGKAVPPRPLPSVVPPRQ